MMTPRNVWFPVTILDARTPVGCRSSSAAGIGDMARAPNLMRYYIGCPSKLQLRATALTSLGS